MKNIIKDKKKLIFLIVALLIVISVIVLIVTYSDDIVGVVQNPDGTEIKNEYEVLNNQVSDDGKEYPIVEIPSNNILKYVAAEDIINILNNNGDAVIYFGYPTCVYCRNAIQVLYDVASTTELDAIYYYDIEKEDDKYSELMDNLDEKFIVTEGEEKNIYSPLVVFIANGKIVSYNKGTLFSQEDPYKELDSSQIRGLSEIYSYGIKDVLNSIERKKK